MNKQAMLTLMAGAALGIAATVGVTVTRAEEPPSPSVLISTESGPRRPAGVTLVPLDTLVAGIEKKHGGRVTEIELERRPWGDLYEVELTDSGFREWDFVVDARTGELLRENRDFD